MAANKFASMLHRKTNRFTLILVYALLEWTLIILLLLNSLFSYLIIKFADHFGLRKPCLLCSRLDHLFEPRNCKKSYKDLICDNHASEIAQLGYCTSHRKLAESQDMCLDCSSSSRAGYREEFSKKFAFFPWMKQIGMVQGGEQDGVQDAKIDDAECSCCGVKVDRKVYSPHFLVKPSSWDVLDCPGKVIFRKEEDDGRDEISRDECLDRSGSELIADRAVDGIRIEEVSSEMVSDAAGEGLAVRVEDAEEDNCSVCGNDSRNSVCGQHMKKGDFVELQKVDMKENDVSGEDAVVHIGDTDGKSFKIRPQDMEFFVDRADYRLIPVELIDASMGENQSQYKCKEDNEDFIMEFDLHDETIEETNCNGEEKLPLLSVQEIEKDYDVPEPETLESGANECSSVLQVDGDSIKEQSEQDCTSHVTDTPAKDNESVQETALEDEEIDADRHIAAGDFGAAQAPIIEDEEIVSDGQTRANYVDDGQATSIKDEAVDADSGRGTEEVSEMRSDEDDAEISIGTEIPDHEHIDEMQAQEILNPCSQEEPSTSFEIEDKEGSKIAEIENMELKTASVEKDDGQLEHSLFLSFNEIEEEKTPDTPCTIDSFHQLYKKSILLERRDSGTEESLDGSVISDIEYGDGPMAIEKLKSALKTERKALNSLYAELDEERSASAVAASQTMAMINRLQEEKASMQMEALQYQRMMEEQAEYDQEALQLLNELMVKREKEKQELEKELEIYRKKLQEYEAKEKMMMSMCKDKSNRSRISSASCSNADDSDGLSLDLEHEAREIDAFDCTRENGNHKTPADAVLYLEDSLANFEEERLSILEQLKGLEEKMLMLSDEEENCDDMKQIKHLLENSNGYDHHFDISDEVNGLGNGHLKGMNGNQGDRRNFISKAKRLLPLFDATETEHGEINGDEQGCESVSTIKSSVTELDGQNKKLAVEEEVDHVYERLQALEADREFLKHCIGSLQKGDKGLYLLQEILQHLRDLKSVELRARSSGDGTL